MPQSQFFSYVTHVLHVSQQSLPKKPYALGVTKAAPSTLRANNFFIIDLF